ncbi:molybdopterin-synthase adenylyltransferase MoeB [Cellulomonas denverensis]|uniref:molybdopterin-synthase adenylyltransferase MoeB n=1 Tax=Cellulomonas denverensis TaxID=264297 RepID=UPI0035EAFC41
MALPPLVEPGPPLNPEEVTRFSRHVLVPTIGTEGQRRLRAARVLVVGAGGLGSPVLLYLAAAGVGTLGIVDDDLVDTSNLQRQIVHGSADLGRPKTTSAAESVRGIQPLVTVIEHRERLTAANALDVIAGYDLVIDGTDNFPTRYLVNDACVLACKPLVWGSILRWDGQVSVFWADPPAGYQGVHYRDVFPEPPAPGTVPSCAEAGVFGVVCGSIGSAMATEAVKLICGVGEPLLGRMLVLDALTARWREIPLRPAPGRLPVTALTDEAVACAVPGEVSSATSPPEAIDAVTLARRLAARERGEDDFDLVDVRKPAERELVTIPGARSIPLAAFLDGTAFDRLDPERTVVLHCKLGGRSAQAQAIALDRGYRAVQLTGGVLGWVDQIDPSLPRY